MSSIAALPREAFPVAKMMLYFNQTQCAAGNDFGLPDDRIVG